MKKLSLFFKTVIYAYLALVTAIWGFVEAFTYFQGDSLKRMLGGNWVWLYILPFVISLCVALVRIVSNKKIDEIPKEIDSAHKSDIPISIRNSGNYYKYKGLLWKRGRFRFQNPTPTCPIANCYRPADCFRINPPQHLISSDMREMQDFLKNRNTYRFVYRCPLHGDIESVPSESLQGLTRQAKYEQNRK